MPTPDETSGSSTTIPRSNRSPRLSSTGVAQLSAVKSKSWGYTIDRASTKLPEKWVETRLDKKEGLHHWLTSLASSALKDGEKVDEWTFVYLGIKFVFDYGEVYPSLVTQLGKVTRCIPGSFCYHSCSLTNRHQEDAPCHSTPKQSFRSHSICCFTLHHLY